MKKLVILVITIFSILYLVSQSIQASSGQEQEEIAKKLIRFHVIANSDSEQDQKLKLQVRDEVLKYISPKLKKSTSIKESREILRIQDKNIQEIAKRVIKEKGYAYSVQTSLSEEYFPVKTYGNITLPQGKYEAFRIIIGTGEGHNWWCVMFPPLCFVDVTKGNVSYEKTEKEMKQVLSEKEYQLVDNTIKKEPVKFKFKVVELLDNLFK